MFYLLLILKKYRGKERPFPIVFFRIYSINIVGVMP